MIGALQSIEITCRNPFLEIGIVVATSVQVFESPVALQNEIRDLCSEIQREQKTPGDRIKTDIRLLLRQGGYKPAGRGRPASEYLANAAMRGEFPLINNVVDINNLISLESGLPGSLLDLEKTGSGLVIRYGLPDESYVFNASGQEILLEGLVCICQAVPEGHGQALGNPVKDSMFAKTTLETTSIIGVLFSHHEVVPTRQLEGLIERYRQRLVTHACAEHTWCGIYR